MLILKHSLGCVIALPLLWSPAIADDLSDRSQKSTEWPANMPIKYIGNAESHKFHRPSCPFARIMALNKRVQFYYRSQAVACGHAPCKYCLPPIWTTVRGCIVSGGHSAQQQEKQPEKQQDPCPP